MSTNRAEDAASAAEKPQAADAAGSGETMAEPSAAAAAGTEGADAEAPQAPAAEADSSDPVEQLTAALGRAKAEAKRNYDRLLRTAADAENFKKRAKRETKEAVRYAEDRLVCSFLPVVDNLERAIEHAQADEVEDADGKGLISGVRMVHKQFLTLLEGVGIQPFVSVGNPFDPELHEAIQQLDSDKPKNEVVAEMQKGYRREGKLVRPAMVIVSKGSLEEQAEAAEPEQPDADADAVGAAEPGAAEPGAAEPGAAEPGTDSDAERRDPDEP